MKTLEVHKLNESYSCIDADSAKLQQINNFLKVERPGAFFDPLVKAGMRSPYDFFGRVQNNKLLILNGHRELLQIFGVTPDIVQPDYTENELNTFLDIMKPKLPFPPYDFQEIAFRESILRTKQINKMATGSGKSMTISLIAEFFRKKGKKGLLLVPTINLLTQFKKDIGEYNLSELYADTHVIGGGSTDKHFNGTLTISTWQSLQNWHDDLDSLDYVIVDEGHRFASEETSAIIKNTVNCKYKFGFTGTIPDNPVMKMQLFGLFGLPKTYITSKELIQRELGTPIEINAIIFNYNSVQRNLIREAKGYAKKLKLIKDNELRNEFIVNLSTKLRSSGNTLVLGQHTEHIKSLYIDVMNKIYPEIKIENKNITGKKSFEFQEQYGIYFINGEDNAETREKTRKILEEHTDAICISNYSILSTGVNIRALHNLILASPMKSYTTITQSIGRMMRLHETKSIARIFDLVDDLGIRKPSGIFYKQFQHRKGTSYNPEEFPVKEIVYTLK